MTEAEIKNLAEEALHAGGYTTESSREHDIRIWSEGFKAAKLYHETQLKKEGDGGLPSYQEIYSAIAHGVSDTNAKVVDISFATNNVMNLLTPESKPINL